MKRRGNTLVATMVTFVIIAILAVVFLKGGCGGGLSVKGSSPRADGKGVTTVGLVKAKAQDDVCHSNLSQIRMSIQVAESSDPDSGHPASLAELKLPSEILKCPIGHEAYTYNPASGEVHCPHLGHEKY